jgi:hypothetical protein
MQKYSLTYLCLLVLVEVIVILVVFQWQRLNRKISKMSGQHNKNTYTFENHTSVKNNIDIMQNMKQKHVPTIYVDIANLYMNIPIPETFEIFAYMLKQNITHPHINEIISSIITQQILHSTWRSTHGLSISSFITEIFIHHNDQTHSHTLNNNNYAPKIMYWYRYVDDIILIQWKKQTNQLHRYIYEFHPKLNFKLQTEENKSVNFLDITITKTGNKNAFIIYRCYTYLTIWQNINNIAFHEQQIS